MHVSEAGKVSGRSLALHGALSLLSRNELVAVSVDASEGNNALLGERCLEIR